MSNRPPSLSNASYSVPSVARDQYFQSVALYLAFRVLFSAAQGYPAGSFYYISCTEAGLFAGFPNQFPVVTITDSATQYYSPRNRPLTSNENVIIVYVYLVEYATDSALSAAFLSDFGVEQFAGYSTS